MDTFWEYFSVLAPSVGLALIFWLVMRSLFRADSGERSAKAAAEEAEAQEWARRRREDGRSEDRSGSRFASGPIDESGIRCRRNPLRQRIRSFRDRPDRAVHR